MTDEIEQRGGWPGLVLRFWDAFRPRADATPREVRLAGLGALLVGLVVCAAGVAIFLAVRSWALAGAPVVNGEAEASVPRIVGVPMAAGYVLFMVGFYRLLTGTAPGKESKSALASLGRILLGLVITLSTLAAVFMLVAMLAR
jgi:hypothetical protein